MGQLEFDEKVGQELEALYSTRDVLLLRTLFLVELGAQEGDLILDAG